MSTMTRQTLEANATTTITIYKNCTAMARPAMTEHSQPPAATHPLQDTICKGCSKITRPAIASRDSSVPIIDETIVPKSQIQCFIGCKGALKMATASVLTRSLHRSIGGSNIHDISEHRSARSCIDREEVCTSAIFLSIGINMILQRSKACLHIHTQILRALKSSAVYPCATN